MGWVGAVAYQTGQAPQVISFCVFEARKTRYLDRSPKVEIETETRSVRTVFISAKKDLFDSQRSKVGTCTDVEVRVEDANQWISLE